VVMIATAVGDIMMATANLLFLILFFQYSNFLKERQNENPAMTIHCNSCKLFWTEVNGSDPLAYLDDACTVSFLRCGTCILWRDSYRSES